ncbi:hypothetical protein B0H13DRAFT_1904404 [Mycena leptocephala]|nr:hypothetical protein B0H13DRAFT_1904404 [Mycena leptocephala]
MASAGDDDLDIPLEEDEPTQGPWPFSFRFDYVPQFGFGIPSPFKRLPKPRTRGTPGGPRPTTRGIRPGTNPRKQANPPSDPNFPPSNPPPPPPQDPNTPSGSTASNPAPPPPGHGAAPSSSNPPPEGTPASNPAPSPPGYGAAPSSSNPPPPPPGHGAAPSSSNPPPPPPARAPRLRAPILHRLMLLARARKIDLLLINAPHLPARSGSKRTIGPIRVPGRNRKKGGPKNWAIPRNAVPEEAAGLQRALHLHLRILMGLLSQRDVPTRLSADAMAPFEARFACADDVHAQLSEILAAAIPPTSAIRQQVTDFLKTAKAAGTQTGADAHRVGEDHLRSIFNTVANAALPYFAPDVFGNPESMYNLAHEHIAIHSFRAAAMLFAYSSIYRVTLSYVQDQHLLQRFYRSFIYGHMKTLAAKEERRPGRVELDVVLNAIYRRREETLSMRQEQIIRDCFMNGFVMKLAAERECHSDDEEADDVGVSRVHEKPGRDGAVSALFGVLDARRDAVMAQKKKKGAWRPRNRQRVLPPSNLSRALPTTVPIDYFSPKFFNDLSVWDCASYMDNGIALPLEEHCQTWEAIQQWRSLSTADFMARYGNAKLALYNIPTEDELAMLASMDEDD